MARQCARARDAGAPSGAHRRRRPRQERDRGGSSGSRTRPPSFPRWVFEGRTYEEALEEVKREYLLHLFDRFDGDLDEVAHELGTTKRNVYLRFAQLGIRPLELRRKEP